jgi:hypothetical protein
VPADLKLREAGMGEGLLKNVFYGNEINNRRALLRWAETMAPTPLSREQVARVESSVVEYFRKEYRGVFGGPITAGDGVALASFMEMIRPVEMIEIGVASGFSSSFILSHALTAGLLREGKKFLYSIDLMAEHAPDKPVGSYLFSHYGQLAKYWDLQTEVTTAALLREKATIALNGDGPVVAFVDGGHNHPWPVVDLIYLRNRLPRGSWVILQDVRMMERWIADCIVHGVTSPSPVRGVEWATSHWPGSKIFGFDTVYNSCAVCLDVSDSQMSDFVNDCRRYPYEIAFPDEGLFEMVARTKPLLHGDKSSEEQRKYPQSYTYPIKLNDGSVICS